MNHTGDNVARISPFIPFCHRSTFEYSAIYALSCNQNFYGDTLTKHRTIGLIGYWSIGLSG